jgi:hypothetical protein
MGTSSDPSLSSDHHGAQTNSQVDLRAANLSFLTDETPRVAPINSALENEISEHRRRLFQDFEKQVILPFAKSLASNDAQGIVKVAGSYNKSGAKVRLSSDVDMVVLSPLLKDPEQYLRALLELSNLAERWRDGRNANGEDKVEPYFFTRAITEEDKFTIVELVTQCEPRNIIPCHFLYYRDEAEILAREGDLGKRLLEHSRPALQRRGSTDAIFNPEIGRKDPARQSTFDAISWNIERAIADLVLNHAILPSRLFVRSYANQIFNVVRNLADELPISEEQKTLENILVLLDQDRGTGLSRAFDPIVSIRNGADIGGEKANLSELLTPAVEIVKSFIRLRDIH